MSTFHRTILLALLCLWTSTDSLLVVQSPSHLAKEHMAVGYTFIGKQGEWLITGKLVQADPIYPCDVADIKNAAAIQGAIVVTKHGNCIEGDQARILKSLGAQGMMVWSSGAFFFQGGLKNNDGEGLDDFPMVDYVNYGDEDSEALKLALDNNEDIVVTLAPDPNFVANEAVWTPYSIFIIGFSLVNIVLAVWKLRQFVRIVGFQLSLSQIVLSLEIFANIMRIPHGIEPASEGRGIFPGTLQSLLFTFSWPYSFIATMMIAFYWEETLGRFSGKAGLSKENFSSLKRMKIPAIIVSVVLIGMEHILQGLIAARVPGLGTSAYITSAIYLAVALVVGIYFAFTGCRVVLFLRKTMVSNSGTRILKRMGLLVGLSGIGLLIYILGNIITAASLSSANLSFIAFSEALLFAGLDLSSATQILCFTSPGDEATNSNSHSGSKSFSRSKSGKDPKENSVPTSVQPEPAAVSSV